MAFTINAFNHTEWQRHGLPDFADFAEKITEINQGEDSFSGYGEWFYIPEQPLPNGDFVIYHGSWGNDNSPGASTHTHATIFDGGDPDEMAEYAVRVRDLESQPEFDEQPDHIDE